MQIIFAALLILVISVYAAGCGLISGVRMPFNGDITFHDITATVPESFIRDSTQSNNDMWIFESGNYSEYIIISRTDITKDTDTALNDYVDYMIEQGAESQRGTFLYTDAVLSTYTKDGKYCQEILFAYNGSFYAVALRGGTEEEFQSLLDTVNTPDTVDETQ